SRYLIKKYIQNSHRDIFEVKQLRLMICSNDNRNLGMIDVFDLDPRDRRAALGILIVNKDDREKGYGAEVLSLISSYCFIHLGLHQVYANVVQEYVTRIYLFEKCNFQRIGVKQDWVHIKGKFIDEILYQLIHVH